MSIRRVQDLRAFAKQHFVFIRVVSGVTAAYVVIFGVLLACLPLLASTLIVIVVSSASVALGNLLIRGYFDRFKAKHQFRQSLVQRLRTSGMSGFDLDKFAAEAGVSHSVATESAEMIYAEVYHRALADGKVTSSEAATLDRLGSALALVPVRRAELERLSKESKYRESVLAALDDGVVTEEEIQQLHALRTNLGLAAAEVARATEAFRSKSYKAVFEQVTAAGGLSQRDALLLSGSREALGVSSGEAQALTRAQALDCFRLRLFRAKQDGRISPTEEADLARLQTYLGLTSADTDQFHREIERIKYLERLRGGQLPSVRTNRLFEGGEICHWDSPCQFQWETAKQVKSAAGQIILTSQRAIFASSLKSFEFRPTKIIDIRLCSQRVIVQTSGTKGTGRYFVNDSEAFAATLEAVTRKQKFLLAEGFSTTRTRHIPDHIKHDVWARDGGSCVRCGSHDYLEFDHIIPFTRGGANTVNNIQILCRRCNGEKSDRV